MRATLQKKKNLELLYLHSNLCRSSAPVQSSVGGGRDLGGGQVGVRVNVLQQQGALQVVGGHPAGQALGSQVVALMK